MSGCRGGSWRFAYSYRLAVASRRPGTEVPRESPRSIVPHRTRALRLRRRLIQTGSRRHTRSSRARRTPSASGTSMGGVCSSVAGSPAPTTTVTRTPNVRAAPCANAGDRPWATLACLRAAASTRTARAAGAAPRWERVARIRAPSVTSATRPRTNAPTTPTARPTWAPRAIACIRRKQATGCADMGSAWVSVAARFKTE
jgi:hypothetical protein